MDAAGWERSSFIYEPVEQSRGRLVRRVIVFQFKLLADGIRDLVMSPLSIVAALVGFFADRRDPELYFDRLMYFGRETDRHINLFDQYGEGHPRRAESLDAIAEEIEATIRQDFEEGGLSARGAARLRQLAMKLRNRRREHSAEI
ncbi:MAG: hypothetical protein JJ913_14970 [Rhizobiaceae bacterium]|nr:hypothetical protein [Rhizobiaceae bacterium]